MPGQGTRLTVFGLMVDAVTVEVVRAMRAEGARVAKLQRRVEAADVGGHGVEGARVDDDDAGGLCGLGVLEQAAVDKLGLAAEVGVVGL